MKALNRGPVISAGVLLGAGLGGFVDGILFHQILQWHNMLSSVRPPVDLLSMKYNMVWDGFFHAATWLMVVFGLRRLWLAGKRADVAWSTPTFVGAALLGWGLFNFIEGLIDHRWLKIHHLHPGAGELIWDWGFVGFGLLQVLAGSVVLGMGAAGSRPPGSEPAGDRPRAA